MHCLQINPCEKCAEILKKIGDMKGGKGMADQGTSLHSICRWTFNAGQGGFLPADMRPQWRSSSFGSADAIKLVADEIRPRLPQHVELGIELHYDAEVNEDNAEEIRDVIRDTGMTLAMITPGAHFHFGYGGVCSLDADERAKANEFAQKTVDLAYGPLRDTWTAEDTRAPTLVLWNGSFGYDMASIAIQRMYRNLKENIAGLCRYEEQKGGQLFIGFEPKPNEGHPAMLIPTVASGLLFWRKLEEEYGISRERKGINKEFGHSEMIGLDHVHDSVEELDDNGMVHVHLNSQGYNDGISLGGPGKFDIDNITRINGMNIAIAGLMQEAGYLRWKGHDIQPRPYDNREQAVDRVVRSVLSWEACSIAARELDNRELLHQLELRKTAVAEDMIRDAVMDAQKRFDEMYNA